MMSMTVSSDSSSRDVLHSSQAVRANDLPALESARSRGTDTAVRPAARGQSFNRRCPLQQRPLCPYTGVRCVAEIPTLITHDGPRWHDHSAASGWSSGHSVCAPAEPADAVKPARPQLSVREKEVLIAWLRTDSKVAVGQTLFITLTTVRTHIQRIREKYEAVGRPASTKAVLAVRAIQDGFITPDDL